MSASPQLVALGRAIRRARRDRNLTQEELAARAVMHPKSISAIERGTINAKTLTVLRIAEAMRMPAKELYTLYDRALAGDPLTPGEPLPA